MKAFFQHAGHAGINRQRPSPPQQIRPAGDCWVETLGTTVVDRKDVVANRFLHEDCLQLFEFLGILRSKILWPD
jgi:hypothetical protein